MEERSARGSLRQRGAVGFESAAGGADGRGFVADEDAASQKKSRSREVGGGDGGGGRGGSAFGVADDTGGRCGDDGGAPPAAKDMRCEGMYDMVDALTYNMKEWSLTDMGKLRSGVEAAIPTAKQRKQYRAKKHVVLHVEACSHSFLHCASLYVRTSSTNLSPRVCYIVKVSLPPLTHTKTC